MTIATDIICGFPTETAKNFEETLDLCRKYKFPSLFINQFFPRPGTPAALLPRIPTQEVKQRTKLLTDLFYSYQPYDHKINEIQEVLVTEISHDKKHYVGHNKFYEQVLVPLKKEFMGKLLKVRIVKTSKFSMIGEPSDEAKMPGLTHPLEKGQISGVAVVNSVDQTFIFGLIVVIISIMLRIFWYFKYQ